MKKNLLFFVLVFIASTVFGQEEARQLTWNVLKTTGDITIDGVASDDEPWADAETNAIDQFIPLPAPDPADFDGGTAKLLWKDNGLYIYVEVKDNEIVPFPTGEDIRDNWWKYDFVEVYLVRGGDPVHGDSIRTADGKYTEGTYNCALNVMSTDSTGSDTKNEGGWAYFDYFGKGMQVGWQQTADGYAVEIFFPWSLFQLDGSGAAAPAAEGQEYGFDFRTNDTDSDQANKHVAMWNNDTGDDNVWNYINYFGKIVLQGETMETRQLNLEVPKTEDDITIDGVAADDEPWSKIDFIEAKEFIPYPPEDENDFAVQYKMLWKDKGLYVYYDVTDNDIVPFPVGEDIRDNWWHYDFMELYLVRGGDPVHGDSIRTADGKYTDGTYNCVINAMTTDSTGSDTKNEGGWAYFDYFGKGMEAAFQQTATGYSLEVYYPWSIFQLDGSGPVDAAAEGSFYGFDIRGGDVDNNDDMVYTVMWNNNTGDDNVWNYINHFGKITLGKLLGVSENYAKVPVTVYPNPATNLLKIEADNMQSVAIMNMMGQKVKELEAVSNQISVNVSDFTPGVYFVIITNDKGEKGTRRVIINK